MNGAMERLRRVLLHARSNAILFWAVNACPHCMQLGNPLLHVANPLLCPARPPFGGWPEPHKDEL